MHTEKLETETGSVNNVPDRAGARRIVNAPKNATNGLKIWGETATDPSPMHVLYRTVVLRRSCLQQALSYCIKMAEPRDWPEHMVAPSWVQLS